MRKLCKNSTKVENSVEAYSSCGCGCHGCWCACVPIVGNRDANGVSNANNGQASTQQNTMRAIQ